MIRGSRPRELSDLSRDELLLVIQHIEHDTATSISLSKDKEWMERIRRHDVRNVLYLSCCYRGCNSTITTFNDGTMCNGFVKTTKPVICKVCYSQCCGENGHTNVWHDQGCGYASDENDALFNK